MPSRIKKDFINFIEKQELISSGDTVLLAVSGGVDSVVMCELFDQMNQKFSIAHCNFQLRGKESDQDEEFVRKLAEKYKVPFFSKKFNTLVYTENEGISTQMGARNLRYQWFEQLQKEKNIQKLATAHHQNDVLETVLLNMSRGTGIAGFHGIAASHNNIIRPLLFLKKEEIIEYATVQKLKWKEDKSNNSNKYKRNLIRNKVIPLLKKLNPNLEKTMMSTVSKMEGAEWIVQDFIKQFKKNAFTQRRNDVLIDINQIPKNNHTAFILFEGIREYGFSYNNCLNLSEVLESSQSGLQFFSSSHRLIKDRKKLVIVKLEKEVDLCFQILENTKHILLNDYVLLCSFIDKKEIDFNQENHIYLDPKTITFPLNIRTWKHGDRFQPYGMKGKYKKISDLLIDMKVPLNEKEKVMVMCSEESILAVLGYRTSEVSKVTSFTEKVYKIEWTKK